ncbi:unnamed protein product [Withania somnifera]
MEERIARSEKYIDDGKPIQSEFEDLKLYHYAIFSYPSQHVSHVVTDKMNLWAIQVMFKMKDYSLICSLNSSYVPVLKQLESAKLQQFYFNNKLETATKDTNNMIFRKPNYLSILNHLRFYLPEIYPKLHRILFLYDVVVQRGLTRLWKVDMDGKVNGAVESCFGSCLEEGEVQ